MKRIVALIISMITVFTLSSCGFSNEPEAVETLEATWFGYSMEIPEYYYVTGISNGGEDNDTEKVCEIENQAVFKIVNIDSELSQDDFNNDYLKEFSSGTGIEVVDYETSDTDIDGKQGKTIIGENDNGDKIKAVIFLNEEYGNILIVYVQELNTPDTKEYSYLNDFDVIPPSIKALSLSEYLDKIGYSISIPEYYDNIVPGSSGMNDLFVCEIGSEAVLQVEVAQNASDGSLDFNDNSLDYSLSLDGNRPEINREDEETKGTIKIRKYTFNYPGTYATGAGAMLYNTSDSTLICIDVIQNGANATKDYVGDINSIVDSIEYNANVE